MTKQQLFLLKYMEKLSKYNQSCANIAEMDEANDKKAWTGSEIKEAYGVAERTVSLLAKRFVKNGLENALECQKQVNRHHKVTGEVEAQMIAIAC